MNAEVLSPAAEMIQDVLSIIHCFSSKVTVMLLFCGIAWSLDRGPVLIGLN